MYRDKDLNKDENEIKNNKNLKTTYVLAKISLIMYVCIFILTILALIEFYKDNSGAAGWIIVILVLFAFMPFIACIVLSVIASCFMRLCRKNGMNIPKRINIIQKINIFQIPIIILVLIIGFNLKDAKYNNYIKQKLDEIYNSKYKIINKETYSNEGGDNYELVTIEIENFDYPVTCKFDWANSTYEDNYEELIESTSSQRKY